eukprot:6182427-Pleurochrysis_carterae.AAC.1
MQNGKSRMAECQNQVEGIHKKVKVASGQRRRQCVGDDHFSSTPFPSASENGTNNFCWSNST